MKFRIVKFMHEKEKFCIFCFLSLYKAFKVTPFAVVVPVFNTNLFTVLHESFHLPSKNKRSYCCTRIASG